MPRKLLVTCQAFKPFIKDTILSSSLFLLIRISRGNTEKSGGEVAIESGRNC